MTKTDFIVMGLVALVISVCPGRGISNVDVPARPEERNVRLGKKERICIVAIGLGSLLYGIARKF
jgi:hypothetical protein